MSVFQTKSWQDAWWKQWGQTDDFKLVCKTEGLSSRLYLDSYHLKGFLPVRCLQFVGTNYRRLSTPRSEYNTLGLHLSGVGADDNVVMRHLLSIPWTEAVFQDMRDASAEMARLRELAESQGWLWRKVAEDTAYSIATSGSWHEYLASLGSNTRLRLFNRRKRLLQLGHVELCNAWPDNTKEFFCLLNDFHAKRWGRSCFNEQSLAFHREFLESFSAGVGQPELSVLSCAGRPISVLYNVEYEGCVYNIQAGYEENAHKNLAIGTLHLGYSIEDAFRRRNVSKFDLLAGEGKHENYKRRLATDSEKLVSVMLVRSLLFQLLYRMKGL